MKKRTFLTSFHSPKPSSGSCHNHFGAKSAASADEFGFVLAPLQNTFKDDFSPSSTSSADLSGLGTEPKTPGLSHSIALSSDEVLWLPFIYIVTKIGLRCAAFQVKDGPK